MNKRILVLCICFLTIILFSFVGCDQETSVVFPEWLVGSWDYGLSYDIVDTGAGVKNGIVISQNSVKMAGQTVYDSSQKTYTDNYKVSVSDSEVSIEAKADSKVYYKFIKEGTGKVKLKISTSYNTSTFYLKNESAHEHVFSTEWTSDETYHWHASKCGHPDVIDKSEHYFDGTICTVCGYDSHDHTFSSSWTSDDVSHWYESTCGHEVKGSESKHTFGPDTVTVEPTCVSAGSGYHTCTICGKTVEYTIPAEPDNHTFNSDGVCSGCYLHEDTGLYVFYDKGVYSNGWRYLEAAPMDLRAFDGVATVSSTQIYSTKYKYYVEGYVEHYYGYYMSGNASSNKLFVNGTKTYNSSDCTGTAIGTGKTNTNLLVTAMGNNPYVYLSPATQDCDYAAKLCDNLTYTVKGVTYDDWFLPSIDELEQLLLQRDKIGGFDGYYYWSSSEDSSKSSAENVLVINRYKGWGDEYEISRKTKRRYETCRIRPIRAF